MQTGICCWLLGIAGECGAMKNARVSIPIPYYAMPRRAHGLQRAACCAFMKARTSPGRHSGCWERCESCHTSSTTFIPVKWAKWRIVLVWSP